MLPLISSFTSFQKIKTLPVFKNSKKDKIFQWKRHPLKYPQFFTYIPDIDRQKDVEEINSGKGH